MCFGTQGKSVEFEYLKNKYFQSCHTSRANTRAGFESAPLANAQTVALQFLSRVRLLAA
jgi:hypothetical protein